MMVRPLSDGHGLGPPGPLDHEVDDAMIGEERGGTQ